MRKHIIQVAFALLLLVLGRASPAHAQSADDAVAAAKALPGFSLVTHLITGATADGSAYKLYETDQVEAYAFRGAHWHASLSLEQPAAFAMPGLDQLGAITLSSVTLIASAQTDSIEVAALPASLRTSLGGFATGGTLALKQGINVFLAGVPGTTGALGTLRSALGVSSGDVRLTGTVGAGVFAQALSAAGITASDADGAVDVTVVLPAIVPPPFNLIPATDHSKLHLKVNRSELRLANGGGAWDVTGVVNATAKLAGATVTLDGALTVSGSGTARTTSINLMADASVGSLFGITGLSLEQIGVKTVVSGSTRSFAVQARIDVNGSDKTATFSATMDRGKLVELMASLSGDFVLPGLPAEMGTVTVSNPALGLMAQAGEGFVGGTASWKRASGAPSVKGTALLWARKKPSVGTTLFLKVDVPKLSRVFGALPTGVHDLAFPKLVVVASTIDVDRRWPEIPGPAQTILTDLGVTPDRAFTAATGISLAAAITPPADLGVSGDMVITGAIGFSPMTMKLTADLGTWTLPAAVTSAAKLRTAAPKLFLAITGSSLEVGAELELAFDDGGNEVKLAGAFAGVITSASPPSLALRGQLVSHWVNALGMTGVSIKKDTGIAFELAADGSVGLTMQGKLGLGANTYGLGGAVRVLLSTGIPVPKAFALRLDASELGLITPVEVGQMFLKAASGMAAKLQTAAGGHLPSAVKTALNLWKDNVANIDMTAKVASVLPTTGPLAEMATLKLEDVVLFIATPGMSTPEFPDLDDVGIAIKGALVKDDLNDNATTDPNDKVLAQVDAFLTLKKGFQLQSAIADITLGPVALKRVAIDIGAGIPFVQSPTQAPRFVITGAAVVGGVEVASLDVNISKTEMRAAGGVQIGLCKAVEVNKLVPGALVALYSPSHKAYLRLTDDTVVDGSTKANATDLPLDWKWEQWRVVDAGSGQVALRNEAHGRYLRIDGTDVASVSGSSLPSDTATRFKAIAAPRPGAPGLIALWNPASKRLVRHTSASAVDANQTSETGKLADGWDWERYQIVQLTDKFPCGDFGVRADLSGSITGLTSFSLSGSFKLKLPKVGDVQLPAVDTGTIKLNSPDGLAIDKTFSWGGASFGLEGHFKSLTDWQLTGTAETDRGEKEFEIGDVVVARMTPDSGGYLKMTIGDDGVTIRVKVTCTIEIPALGELAKRVFSVSWDGELPSDLAIRTTVSVPDPEAECTVEYDDWCPTWDDPDRVCRRTRTAACPFTKNRNKELVYYIFP